MGHEAIAESDGRLLAKKTTTAFMALLKCRLLISIPISWFWPEASQTEQR